MLGCLSTDDDTKEDDAEMANDSDAKMGGKGKKAVTNC